MCDQDQDQSYIAPGYDVDHHDCAVCLDLGISQEIAGYCTSCRMGKRIEQLDQFAEQLKGHGFTEAMRIVYRTTQRTEKAIAAADKALMVAQHAAKVKELRAELMLQRDTTETFGIYSSETARVAIEGCIDTLDEIFSPSSPVSKQG